jgi:hypothetical protein
MAPTGAFTFLYKPTSRSSLSSLPKDGVKSQSPRAHAARRRAAAPVALQSEHRGQATGGATISFTGRHLQTEDDGSAATTASLQRARPYRVTACTDMALDCGTATMRVRPQPRRKRPCQRSSVYRQWRHRISPTAAQGRDTNC